MSVICLVHYQIRRQLNARFKSINVHNHTLAVVVPVLNLVKNIINHRMYDVRPLPITMELRGFTSGHCWTMDPNHVPYPEWLPIAQFLIMRFLPSLLQPHVLSNLPVCHVQAQPEVHGILV